MSLTGRLDNKTVVHPYYGILLSIEGYIFFTYNLNGSNGIILGERKPVSKGYVLYDFTYNILKETKL